MAATAGSGLPVSERFSWDSPILWIWQLASQAIRLAASGLIRLKSFIPVFSRSMMSIALGDIGSNR